MIKICLIALVCLGTNGASSPRSEEPKADNSADNSAGSEIEWQPWLASVQLNGTHICSGSIMAGPLILTAAHCVFFLSLELDKAAFALSARVGSSSRSSGGSVHKVRRFHIHELFFHDSHGVPHNDVALLELERPVGLNKNVQPILLFNRGEKLPSGSRATVTGWAAAARPGGARPDLMVGVELLTAEPRGCLLQSYPGELVRAAAFSAGQICALFPANDTWRGDPGGPLLAGKRPRQAGIASWGTKCDRPAFFTEVAYYYDWIANTMMLAQRTTSGSPPAWARSPAALLPAVSSALSTILLGESLRPQH